MSIVRSVLNAPRQIIRRLSHHPVKAAAVVLAADAVSKLAVRKVADLAFTVNPAYAFGQNSSYSPFTTKLLIGAGLVSLAGLFIKAKDKTTQLAIALIVGGGAGNLIERSLFGGVTDFIQIGSWYSFNLADAAMTTGGILLLYGGFSSGEKSDRSSRLSTLKNSFTKNILNTALQTFLYALTIFTITGRRPTIFGALALLTFSLIRDVRHRGERMF